jgi:signal transduction histidine kinase
MSQHASTDQHNPVHPALREDFRIELGFAVRLDGETTGRLLILDIEPRKQHFLTAPIVASIIESRFARLTFQESREQDEVAVRIRSITRDLHDGLLQSFTGIVLQLENLLPLLESDPDEARRRVTDIEGILMNEQRELRSYLESLSEKKRTGDTDFDMTGRLRDLATRYHDQWGVEVEYRRNVLDPVVRKALGWETYRIITESITNATKHGHAKHVKVALSTDEDCLVIAVQDDGDGFPFRGRLTSDEMIAQGVAPTSLTERVRSLNGEVSIESTDEGSLVEISIPIGWSQS